jgi:hypothetical protein
MNATAWRWLPDPNSWRDVTQPGGVWQTEFQPRPHRRKRNAMAVKICPPRARLISPAFGQLGFQCFHWPKSPETHLREILLTIPATAILLRPGTLPAQTSPRNMLVLADDIGTDALSLFNTNTVNTSFATTPNLDALAAQSVRFRNCYGYPSCSPTRSCLLTRRYARRGISRSVAKFAANPSAFAGCAGPETRNPLGTFHCVPASHRKATMRTLCNPHP